MRNAFLDTVGLLALWDRRDPWRVKAMAAFELLAAQNTHLYTTSYVLAECGNAASRTSARSYVVEFRKQLIADDRLIVPTPEDEAAAWAVYARGEAGDAGIVDHLSFVVMRRLGIDRAFTNDRHFRAAGFETLF